MEALILLMISVCLLSLYGLVYVSLRLVGNVKSCEKAQFRNSLLVMLVLLLISGVSATFLIMS
ncbi:MULTISPECIES: hypothetical protein [Halalkalibacter]|uniref:Uncharacterized protein n=1 Tax=Halalkalibacter alkaliphilus TaxID=2917993 RepID=A0A9X2CNT9_9BACI|nr:hypothetical protein [Halalkalibacter alkaliphilus]MCL7746998.1 hypothetical protein [Halalkalibacter alkaliphilus]